MLSGSLSFLCYGFGFGVFEYFGIMPKRGIYSRWGVGIWVTSIYKCLKC